MPIAANEASSLEAQIGQWRSYLHRRQAIHAVDVAELEDHLREQVASLSDAGLAGDEAFLVAVKRMGSLDALSREFAQEHAGRLWKQLVVVPADGTGGRRWARADAIAAFCLAVAAALAVKAPALFGVQVDTHASFYARNAGLLVLPFLTGYKGSRGRSLQRASSPTSTRRRRAEARKSCSRCTCRSFCGCSWASRTPATGGARSRAAWTSSASRASFSSTTC